MPLKEETELPNTQRIVVAVLTRQRPKMLANCLATLADQTLPDGTEIEIIVVENDADDVSSQVVAEARKQCRFPVRYFLETRQGISTARNRALTEAIERGYDYLAFIDDDELAHRDWISRLYAAMRDHGADLGGGMVGRILEPGAPRWAVRYFPTVYCRKGNYPNIITDQPRTGTGNFIISLSFVEHHKLRFNTRYDLIGAGDSDFVDQALSAGARSVFVNDAIVHEVVPPSRTTLRYLFVRKMRDGSHRVQQKNGSGFLFTVNEAAAGLHRIVMGAVFFILLYPLNQTIAVQFMAMLATGIGAFGGLIAWHPKIYKTVHGQ